MQEDPKNVLRDCDVFLRCQPGLEGLLAYEVEEQLGVRGLVTPGSLQLALSQDEWAMAHWILGIPTQILLRIGKFRARHFDELIAGIEKRAWSRWIPKNGLLRLRIHAEASRLYHTGAIEERVLAAFAKRWPFELTDHEDSLQLHVRIERDECGVFLDAAGSPLHRRGYRKNPFRAPLREDVAHALVVFAQIENVSDVLDPFCGSGSIVIEAARRATGIAPGSQRDFALGQVAYLDADQLGELREASFQNYRRVSQTRECPRFWASDRDAEAVEVARANADAAGVSGAIDFSVANATQWLSAEAPISAIVTNPPWGERLSSGRDLQPLYDGMSKVAIKHHASLAWISSNARVNARLRPSERFRTIVGGGAAEFCRLDAHPFQK